MTRQMTLVGFLQAQNCTNFVGSWRHPEAAQDFVGLNITGELGGRWRLGSFISGFSTTGWRCPICSPRSRGHRRQRIRC